MKDKLLREMLEAYIKYDKYNGKRYLNSHYINNTKNKLDRLVKLENRLSVLEKEILSIKE